MNHVTPDCRHNGHLSATQRRRIFPFNQASSVEVISFKGVYEYDFGEIDYRTPLRDSSEHQKAVPNAIQHQPPKPDTTERVVLTRAQTDALSDILYNYNYSTRLQCWTEDVVGCFHPRQAILWRDSDGQIFGSLEVCFECAGTYSTLPEGSYGVFCDGKYLLLKVYFQGLGITYFED